MLAMVSDPPPPLHAASRVVAARAAVATAIRRRVMRFTVVSSRSIRACRDVGDQTIVDAADQHPASAAQNGRARDSARAHGGAPARGVFEAAGVDPAEALGDQVGEPRSSRGAGGAAEHDELGVENGEHRDDAEHDAVGEVAEGDLVVVEAGERARGPPR